MLVTLMGSLALLGSGCSKKAVIPPDSSGTGSPSGSAGTSGYDENSLAAEGTLDDAATTGSSGMDSASDEYRPFPFKIGGKTVIIFSSNRPGGKGGFDLYAVRIDIF